MLLFFKLSPLSENIHAPVTVFTGKLLLKVRWVKNSVCAIEKNPVINRSKIKYWILNSTFGVYLFMWACILWIHMIQCDSWKKSGGGSRLLCFVTLDKVRRFNVHLTCVQNVDLHQLRSNTLTQATNNSNNFVKSRLFL